jgi:hypothetical protein
MRVAFPCFALFAAVGLSLAASPHAACPQFETAGVSVGAVQNSPGGNISITEASGLFP